MPDRMSRAFFIAELVVFALPTLAAFGFYAVLICGWALFALGAALYAALATMADLAPIAEGDGDPGAAFAIAAGALAAAVIPAAGLISIWSFSRVAAVFALRGRCAIRTMRPVFRRGLLWAIAPMAFTLLLGITTALTAEGSIDVAMGVLLSGVTLSIPILHLAVEISDAPPSDQGERRGSTPPVRGI